MRLITWVLFTWLATGAIARAQTSDSVRVLLEDGTAATISLADVALISFESTSGIDAGFDGSIAPSGTLMPNPSRGPITFSYTPSRDGLAHLEIVDIAGRVIWSGGQVQSRTAVPIYIRWDAADQDGHPVTSGSYLGRVIVDGIVEMQQLFIHIPGER